MDRETGWTSDKEMWIKLLLSMMTTVGKEMIELNFFFIDGTMGQHVKQTGWWWACEPWLHTILAQRRHQIRTTEKTSGEHISFVNL